MATDTEKIIVQVVVQGEKQLKNLKKETDKVTLGFNKLTAGILGAVTAFNQISKAVSTSVRTFRDFEFQMAKTKAVTGASDKEFNKLNISAQKLGRSTFFTAQQVAELQTNYGKLGFTTQQILDAQEATLNLAIASDADLGRAAIVAGAAVKGFGLDVEETTRVVDVMTAAFASSPLDIEKWQTSMTKVAPIAASANISIEATAAVMGALADAGHEASIAGTSLRNIFLKMINPTSDLAQQIGFTVHSSDDLIIALKKLNEAELDNERISEIVDVRQQAIFRTMLKSVGVIEESTNAYNAATGTAKKMSDIIGDTLEGDFKRLTSASQGLAIELVFKLGGGLRTILQRLTDLINKLTDNSESVANLITNIVNLIKYIGLYKLGVFAAAKATLVFRGAVKLLNGSLKITRATLVKTGFGIIAVALGELAERYFFASKAADDYNDKQKDVNKETENLIETLKKELKLSDEALASMLNIGKKTREQIIAEEEAKKEKRFEKEKEQLEILNIESISKLKERYKNNLDTKEEFDEKLFAREQLHLANMLGLYQRYGKNTAEINAEILDNELDRIEKTAEKERDVRKEQIDDIDDLGDALVQLAGENENLNKVREAGVAITQAAAAAESVLRIQEILSEITKGKLTVATILGTKAKVANTAATTAETVATGANTVATTANTVIETASIAPKVASGAASQTKLPFPLNIIAVVATLALLSRIMKSFGDGGVIDTFANGGMVHGKSHAQGGEKFAVGGRVVELEGGEAVINKRSTAMFRNQLSAMNVAGGGVKFADGGLMNMPSFAQSQFNATSQAGMMGAIGQGGKVVVVESDISDVQNTVSVIESEATF
jgi:TP901 family phage tail tape measure protein